MRLRRWAPRAALVALLTAAVVRASTASSATSPLPITPELAHRAYMDIVGREPMMRRDAALKFPGEPWSADDDFHERENEAVRGFSGHQNVPIGDVLRAIDDGMHERWRAAVTPIAQVPPCRPRLMY